MEKLKENYIDDILDTSKNQRRKYQMVNNDDGTISLIDVTDYEQVGSEFLASDMNAITKAVNSFDGKLDKIYAPSNGKTTLNDSYDGAVKNLMVYGKSEQFVGQKQLDDGTTVTVPSPDYPQEIKTVVNPTVKVTGKNGKEQSVTLTGVTLNAIPVPSDGNVTIDGQQYISDYVDAERGKIVRNVKKIKFSSSDVNNLWTFVLTDGITKFSLKPCSYYGIKAKEDSDSAVGCCTHLGVTKIKGSITSEKCPPNIIAVSNGIYIAVKSEIVSTVDELKQWFTDNEVYFYAQLATPTEESLASDQLSALKALQTYYPQTNVSVTSEQIDGYMTFNYPISSGLTGDVSDTTVTFTEPTALAQPTTGEKLSGIIGKVSLAIKNIKTLITLLGKTDISSIGDGTVTGAISDVNGKLDYEYLYNKWVEIYRVNGNIDNTKLAIPDISNYKMLKIIYAYVDDNHYEIGAELIISVADFIKGNGCSFNAFGNYACIFAGVNYTTARILINGTSKHYLVLKAMKYD